MSIQSFDGMDFEINLPASPVNGDEFPGRTDVVVARTVEPAVIADMRPVSWARSTWRVRGGSMCLSIDLGTSEFGHCRQRWLQEFRVSLQDGGRIG